MNRNAPLSMNNNVLPSMSRSVPLSMSRSVPLLTVSNVPLSRIDNAQPLMNKNAGDCLLTPIIVSFDPLSPQHKL